MTPSLSPTDVTLRPRFLVPLGTLVLAAASLALLPLWTGIVWLAGGLALFAAFLAVQTFLLRLRFTAAELEVLRGQDVIRRFPYDRWLSWRIFWNPVPVLFYFRETESPHLLPMLFDGTALRQQLEMRLPREATAQQP
jgi:hypothetical protein